MASAGFADRSGPGGIVHNPASPYAREMAKWEMSYSPYGPPGRPREQVGQQDYPALFYKMKRRDTNGDFVIEHYQEAGSDTEANALRARGYGRGQAEGIAVVEGYEQSIAVAAAQRAKTERSMSDKARAEAQLADDATGQHLPSVPVTPIRKRGRPVKVTKAELVTQS